MKSNALSAGSEQITELFIDQVQKLSSKVDSFSPADQSLTIYNPLEYAQDPLFNYIRSYLSGSCRVVFLGMNPGPFGMAQTGVPFGDVKMVKEWMNIVGKVTAPLRVHPKRPILGFSCERSEVSGSRLWSWAKERFTTPERFFENHFVWNYCPLVFMEESGANKTPDKLPKEEREELFSYCNEALLSLVTILKPEIVIGIGKFARKQAESALGELIESEAVKVGDILHPSPASPKANRNWKGEMESQLEALGYLL